MVGCRKRSNTGGRGYGQNHPYMQCRGSRRAFTTAGAPFHAVSRHEKGLLDNSFPFSLSHMHYVGRSFRLLNQFSRPSPAHSERFSGRKFHRTEIFCRKPKGKRADPQERANFDEEGGNFSRSDGIIDFLLHLFRPTGQDFHAIVPMGIIAIPS